MTTIADIAIETDAPISTWFGVGGRADQLARPDSIDSLRRLLRADASQHIRILGDGANLLVDDEGVDGLVLSLERLRRIEEPEPGLLRVQAGANLPRLIVESVRRGLAGIEGLAGIPAALGGAIRMNAGGAFGQIADVIERVTLLDRAGDARTIERADIDFDYRRSGLEDSIIVAADLRLTEADPTGLRDRFKEVFAYKKQSQPLAADSAGCVFKNPLIDGERQSAGKLIDEAGCKGMTVGAATISDRHANFIVTAKGATASDIRALIDEVRERVRAHRGIELETEVVIWRRGDSS